MSLSLRGDSNPGITARHDPDNDTDDALDDAMTTATQYTYGCLVHEKNGVSESV